MAAQRFRCATSALRMPQPVLPSRLRTALTHRLPPSAGAGNAPPLAGAHGRAARPPPSPRAVGAPQRDRSGPRGIAAVGAGREGPGIPESRRHGGGAQSACVSGGWLPTAPCRPPPRMRTGGGGAPPSSLPPLRLVMARPRCRQPHINFRKVLRKRFTGAASPF